MLQKSGIDVENKIKRIESIIVKLPVASILIHKFNKSLSWTVENDYKSILMLFIWLLNLTQTNCTLLINCKETISFFSIVIESSQAAIHCVWKKKYESWHDLTWLDKRIAVWVFGVWKHNFQAKFINYGQFKVLLRVHSVYMCVRAFVSRWIATSFIISKCN